MMEIKHRSLSIPRSHSQLVYTRAPWQEPDVPNYMDILYEDEDMVSCLSLIKIAV